MTDFNQESPMDVYPVRMTAAHARIARQIGDGNLSKGVREAIEIIDSTKASLADQFMLDKRKSKTK